jgi:hypothetical protein
MIDKDIVVVIESPKWLRRRRKTYRLKFLFVVVEMSLYKSCDPKRIDLGIFKKLICSVGRLRYLP